MDRAPRRHPIEAVLFDMDGVLVDTEPFWREVEAEAFRSFDVDITPTLSTGLTMGLRVDDAVSLLSATHGVEGIDQEALAEKIVAGVVRAIRSRVTLLPGVHRALSYFEDNGIVVALASGSTPPVIDAVLESCGLGGRFAVVCSAIDDQYGKPHPSVFLRASTALSVEPRACVVIEDSLNGCVAAKAARMRVIAIPHLEDANDPRFVIADLMLSSLYELERDDVTELLGLSDRSRST